LVKLGKPAEAREALDPLLANPPNPQTRREAILKAAEASLLAGQPAKAAAAMGPLLEERGEDPMPRVDYLVFQVALAEGRFDAAANGFAKLIEAEDQRIADGSRLGLADALAGREETDPAIDEMVKFVNQRAESPALPLAFQRLDRFGFLERPRTKAMLQTWIEDDLVERKALAQFYEAAAEKRNVGAEAAIPLFEKFREEFAEHFLFPAAMLELGSAYLELNNPSSAIEVLKPLRTADASADLKRAIAFLEARAQFESGEFEEANEQFATAAAEDENAAYNRAVSAIYAANIEDFQIEFQRFGLREEGAKTQALLLLERGLREAATEDPSATATLKEFAQNYPDHPRFAEAQLAVAELALLELPPKPVAAQEALDAALQIELSEDLSEQADYVSFWIAASGAEVEPVAEAAAVFLEKWEESAKRSEIRLKLGETYFGIKDYPNAQNQFELIVEEAADDPNAEVAQFLAGKAASLSMSESGLERAIEHWGKVFDRNGPLAWEALRQQASAKLSQSQPDQALRVLEELLAAKANLEPDLVFATQMDIGRAHYMQAPDHSSPEKEYIASIHAYNQIINDNASGRFWKNQAGYRKGRSLEALSDDDAALLTYFDVVRKTPLADLGEEDSPEYTWYYRSGFAAIALLQRRREWTGAVKMADRLAATSGPRATEASDLGKKLRLEHFLWDEEESADE
ncbi:MAG: tetratricopeptide repeat protein, partial [Verrucomicrobiota bacterium]